MSVESGDVPEVSDSEAEEMPATADATEAEVLADDPSVSDELAAEVIPDDAEPVTDDGSTAEAQDAIDDAEDSTLAAWAGQWDDDDVEGGASEPVEPVAETGMVAESVSDGGEDADPVSRAQELLAELQALIPQIANPAPVATSAVVASVAAGNPPLPDGMLDQLDAADSGGSFDDVRDVIATVQANPRDVDSMLKLANSAERLRDLLDNRDTLAAGALAVRAWIRDQDTSGEDDGDFL
ncbi:MAG TPA: hypothetical protein VD767_05195 [Thermomicrobiales bacterium]|nr:hypothetical protein [Thermomicrobiales bacterium]